MLQSHRLLAAQALHSATSSSSSDEDACAAVQMAAYTKSYAFFYAQQYVDRDIAEGQFDAFFKLPIDGEQPAELHALFRSCKGPGILSRELRGPETVTDNRA